MAAIPWESDLARELKERFGDGISETSTYLGQNFLVAKPDSVIPVLEYLKLEADFDYLVDITAVDWPEHPLRFELVYHFYSTRHFARVRLKTRVADAEPSVDSLISMYGSARFMERECHEMYGIVFRGNRDLRPILLYEGFVGHPLRKDYPKQQEQPLVPYRI